MSLGRLLTNGKSLVGLREATPRYRMRTENPLPKFGSDKNPFTKTETESEPEPSKQPVQAEMNVTNPTTPRYQLTPAQLAAAKLEDAKHDAKPLPASAPIKSEPQISKPAAADKSVSDAKPGLFSRALRKLNPFARRAGKKREPKPAIPRFNKVPVQGELSLDNVKVVRNDLNDADVEVVPAKPQTKKANSGAKPDTEQTPELIKT